MPFPPSTRVIYEINPLEEVICQVRFPTILRIDAEVPAAFQERIRQAYPLYKAKANIRFAANVPGELASLLEREMPAATKQAAYEFSTPNGHWVLTLTRDFLALTCRNYIRWEQFKDRLAGPLEALQDIYKPALFTRLGLRYRDVIRRSLLGLEGRSWAELLSPWIAGAFGSPDLAEEIAHSAHEIVINLPNGRSRAQIHHGLVKEEGQDEQCYLIDGDFFDDTHTEPGHALERLDTLKQQAGLFFRWCIKETLHEAMRPRPLSGD